MPLYVQTGDPRSQPSCHIKIDWFWPKADWIVPLLRPWKRQHSYILNTLWCSGLDAWRKQKSREKSPKKKFHVRVSYRCKGNMEYRRLCSNSEAAEAENFAQNLRRKSSWPHSPLVPRSWLGAMALQSTKIDTNWSKDDSEIFITHA